MLFLSSDLTHFTSLSNSNFLYYFFRKNIPAHYSILITLNNHSISPGSNPRFSHKLDAVVAVGYNPQLFLPGRIVELFMNLLWSYTLHFVLYLSWNVWQLFVTSCLVEALAQNGLCSYSERERNYYIHVLKLSRQWLLLECKGERWFKPTDFYLLFTQIDQQACREVC